MINSSRVNIFSIILSLQLDELGRTLINICNIVPAGIVVFLPSYGYEDLLFKHLETTGVLSKIRMKKSVFREPKLTTQVMFLSYTNFFYKKRFFELNFFFRSIKF